MSAFIVDYKTIDNILSIRLNHDILTNYCYLKSEIDGLIPHGLGNLYEALEEAGKEFLKLNIQSVNERYNETTDFSYAENYKFQDSKPTLAQAIKSLECLMYQSCEIENYEENTTFQKMEKLKQYYVSAFLNLNEEYKNAKWSDCY